MTLRIAMWSGPRNLSTAMMRSFGNRPDTLAVDEPFYAAYLELTGLDHPMRAEILQAHNTDPASVIRAICHEPCGTPIIYQKHMTHHMVEGIPRNWFRACRHAFLIRHPARVIASYLRKRDTVSAEDIGIHRQAELLDLITAETDENPVIVDSDDILGAPEAMLQALCAALEISFTPAMLAWTPGPKPEDGAWAPHWYDAVNQSTGFAPPPGPVPKLNDTWSGVLEETLPIYQAMREKSLRL